MKEQKKPRTLNEILNKITQKPTPITKLEDVLDMIPEAPGTEFMGVPMGTILGPEQVTQIRSIIKETINELKERK